MRFSPLPLILIGGPIAEIVAFGLVVEWLGFWSAFALLLLTSVIGVLIVRQRGFGLISKVTAMARDGKPPAGGVGGDFLTLLAGFLLMLPGFVSDVIGLALLIPFVRHAIARKSMVKTRVYSGNSYTESYSFNRDPQAPARKDGVVDLDADEYERMDRRDPNAPGGQLPDR